MWWVSITLFLTCFALANPTLLYHPCSQTILLVASGDDFYLLCVKLEGKVYTSKDSKDVFVRMIARLRTIWLP